MNRVKWLILLGLMCSQANAQDFNKSYNFINTGTNGPGTSFANTGITSFFISWAPQATIFTCSVQVDSSSDGSTWGSGDLIASQNCANVGSSGAPVSLAIGKNFVRINVTALTGNGSVNVALKGWGGSVSANVSANQVDPTQSPYNVKTDAKTGGDGTTTNTQPTFSSANQNCVTSDVGKLAIVVNTSTGAYPFGTGLVTVLSCNGNAWTLSANANASIAGTANWSIGSGNGAALASANLAAFNAGKVLAVPCGTMIVENPGGPFTNLPTTASLLTQRPDIQGCNATGDTIFILHPNITNGISNGSSVFFTWLPPNAATGSFNTAGLTTMAQLANFTITSLGGAIPGSSNFLIYLNNGSLKNVNFFSIGSVGGGWIAADLGTESYVDHGNFQNFTPSNAWVGVGAITTGQKVFVTNSIFAFTGLATSMQCSGNSFCSLSNSYIVNTTGGLANTGAGATWTITGSVLNANGININDGNVATTYYVFGNQLQNQTATTAVINLQNAGTVLDISGSTITPATSGYSVTGAGTLNDRVGNTFANPLTQFTGQYIPVGGGSLATDKATASTNFGSALGAQNIVAATLAGATYDVKIGVRQVTAGVGCGAGSNTVTPTLNWTSGGAAQATGSNGVPALATLTASANGAVGTSSVYTSIAIHVDINTAISFTTASTLASAGCSTVPQYVVDFSNI